MSTQIQFVINVPQAPANGVLPLALAAITPVLSASSFATIGPPGLRVVTDLPEHVRELEEAVSLHSAQFDHVASQAHNMGGLGVDAGLVFDHDPSFVLCQNMLVVDSIVISQLAAWERGWKFLASSPQVVLASGYEPSVLISRYCHFAALCLGAAAWVSAVPSVDELSALADEVPMGGDWRLMTAAAAESALAFGPSAVFASGELIDVSLLASAYLAVAVACATVLCAHLGVPAGSVSAALASHGPNVDLVGYLSRQ